MTVSGACVERTEKLLQQPRLSIGTGTGGHERALSSLRLPVVVQAPSLGRTPAPSALTAPTFPTVQGHVGDLSHSKSSSALTLPMLSCN